MPKRKTQVTIGQSTYLKQLKFDPKLAGTLIAKYFVQLRLLILLVLSIAALGSFSYLNLPRNLNPEIKIPLVIVSTVLPGAGPNEIESLVTIPVEDSIRGLQKIKTTQSTSSDSVSVISIEFESGVDPDKARSDVQSAVDTASAELPADAQTPRVQKLDFENQPIWTFTLTTKGNPASLFRFANILKDDLENVPSVDRVVISGQEEQEIQLLLKPETISTYNLNPAQLIPLIRTSLKSLPAGSVKTLNSSFTLSIDPAVVSVGDIRNLKIQAGGTTVSLSDIAIVSEKSKPEQPPSYIITPSSNVSRGVSFDVYKTSNARIDKTVREVKEEAASQIKNHNGEFQIFSVRDIGELIEHQYGELQRDLILTVILVTFILFVFLGVRQALVAALTAPLTFFITFTVMNGTGTTLSFIAVFSLLLSLGLLVDDAIVVISAMTAYFRSGKFSPIQTALLVWRDFLAPVLTTTLTTVWAFVPLLLTTGIIGEFIKPIPIVVSTTLLGSIFTALFITFPLMIFLLSPKIPFRVEMFLRILSLVILPVIFYLVIPKDNLALLEILAFLIFLWITILVRRPLTKRFFGKLPVQNAGVYLDHGLLSFHKFSLTYKRVISKILLSQSARRKTMAMVIAFSLFSYLLLPFGFVKNEFFPKTDEDFIFVSLELPPGTSLAKTDEKAKELLEQLRSTPEAEFITADVGRQFSSFSGISQGNTNNVLFSLELVKKEARKKPSYEIAQLIREKFENYTAGKISVQEISGGPPAGADLQIKLFGDNLTTLDQYAETIKTYLAKQAGTANVDKSIKPGTSKLVFIPNQQRITDLGLSQEQIGFWLRLYASGMTADKITLESGKNDKTEINIRLNDQSQQVENINAINIPTFNGNLPLTSLGEIKLEPNPTLITRENGKRTLSVMASVTKGFSITTLNQQLEKYADTLNLPAGYSWQTGGLNEENQRSVNSMIQAMLFSFILIIVTLVIQFNSFRKTLIVMLVIPLSISGVFILFAISQTPLSFPALIGVLALFGIVVKNSILVVDKIIADQKAGLGFVESIADGAASRLEAIALTTLATIFGLIPITFSDPLWRGLGGAIISGLTFSGTIMLLFIPVVYFLLFNKTKGQ